MNDLLEFVHVIKQPLSIVKGFAYLASKCLTTDPEKAKEYLKKIDEKSDEMTDLLNQLSNTLKEAEKE